MSNFDSTFDRIDSFLLGKKKSEITLIFFVAFVFLGFISYSYMSPITDRRLKQTISSSEDMNRKLTAEKQYLASVSKDGDETYAIKAAMQVIENTKALWETTHATNTYVDEKLKQLSYLLFNNKDWANFLNSITQLAQENAIKIKIIDSNVSEPNIQKIEQVLNLKIKFNGEFYSTMKFINSIEESRLVVDIYDFNCTAEKKNLDGTLNIAVWGMKY